MLANCTSISNHFNITKKPFFFFLTGKNWDQTRLTKDFWPVLGGVHFGQGDSVILQGRCSFFLAFWHRPLGISRTYSLLKQLFNLRF